MAEFDFEEYFDNADIDGVYQSSSWTVMPDAATIAFLEQQQSNQDGFSINFANSTVRYVGTGASRRQIIDGTFQVYNDGNPPVIAMRGIFTLFNETNLTFQSITGSHPNITLNPTYVFFPNENVIIGVRCGRLIAATSHTQGAHDLRVDLVFGTVACPA